MAWYFSYDEYPGVCVLAGSGKLSNADLSAAIFAAAGHPKFHPSVRMLYDYVELDASVQPHDVMFDERHDRIFSGSARRAFLVNRSRLSGFAGLLPSRTLVGQVRIFSDRDIALDWLHEGTPPWKKLI